MLENFDRLKVFYHVHTLGSIVGAANVLHVSQSAVSQTILKLEKEINTPLFTRLHKQLIPTTSGTQLYNIVLPFMESLEGYLEDIKTARDHPAGELRIGAPPEFGKAYLPAIVAQFREKYPDVTFTLEFGPPERLLPMLKKNQVDFALVDMFLTRSRQQGDLDLYHFNPVVEEEVILACSRKYHKQHIQDDHSFATLARQNFISYRKDLQTIKQWFKHHFSKPNLQVRDVLTVDNHEAVISAIANDVGLGVIVSHLIKDKLRNGAVIHIHTSKPELMNSISLACLQDKVPTLTERVFERYLIDRIRSIISQSNIGMQVLPY